MSLSPYLYLRGLRQVDHTVFCVSEGQKTYRDPVTGRPQPYSSGQQVKHSVLDKLVELLGTSRAPVLFNYKFTEKDGFRQGAPYSSCNPLNIDELLGGWMQAKGANTVAKAKVKRTKAVVEEVEETEQENQENTLKGGGLIGKRRSPLSISAMRPLHPDLVSISEEAFTFDRGNEAASSIKVWDGDGNEILPNELALLMQQYDRSLPKRFWFGSSKKTGRASGLFVYDVAIDMRRLFAVSLDRFDPELTPDRRDSVIKELKSAGWIESALKLSTGEAAFLILPKKERDKVIPALATSLIEWHITSNQSRTFSLQNTLVVAISDNANKIGAAIRADYPNSDIEGRSAVPILDLISGVEMFTALTANGYVRNVIGSADALDNAKQHLVERLSAFEYL